MGRVKRLTPFKDMMEIYYLFITIVTATFLSACGKNDESKKQEQQNPIQPVDKYKIDDQLKSAIEMQLVWADEFNEGTMVNTANWTYEKGHVRNDEIQYYTEARSENCRIEGGMLIITGRKEATPYNGTDDITSASIITNKKQSWQYGRFEIRAKVPAGNGPWPAFWAKGDGQNTGDGWPKCGEIDIMEYAAKDPKVMIQNVIYGTGSTTGQWTQQTKKPTSDKAYSDEFHVYSLDWNTRQLTFAIDNKVTHVVDMAIISPNPFNQKFSILLNLALGASTERTLGGKLDPSCLPVEFRVDYVRIYQSK
ncbi:Beta-glucanase [termite gut metagenome]|uniref:Beta-glucanase n=1 Tax=termite gut metagenome TaxID=433724 RepID=A0A5J4T1E8_9ZZZZ